MIHRRLIEEELPLRAVNAESGKEKSLRHGHISTMHLWWARRPLAMSRTIVAGTLLPNPSNDADRRDVLDCIANASPFKASTRDDLINPLKKLLAEAYPDDPPRVLDCFAGGGAIPLEALRLGCDTTALDLNPVAHLIEKCVLEYPQRFGLEGPLGSNLLADDFVRWAQWVRDRVEPQLADVFPADEEDRRPAVYFWARTMTCANPACGADIPLLSSFWLADSGRRTVWVEPVAVLGKIDLHVHTGPPPRGLDLSEGTVKASSVTCPACRTSVSAADVRDYAKRRGFGRRLYAVLDIDSGVRTYRAPRPEEIDGAETTAGELLAALDETPDGSSATPDEPVDAIGYINLQNLVFGYDTWSSLFSRRQLYVLGVLCEAARAAHSEMLAEGVPEDRAKAISTYLGLCIDRAADYNSSFATWVPGGEFVRSTFPRQAISMAWDYTEIDLLADVSGSWDGAVRWIKLAIEHCSSTGHQQATVIRGDAQSQPFADDTFDAVIVDPPYYFSVMYSDLSDFFYVWLKRSVGYLYPGLFSTRWTPKEQEIIQNRTNPRDPRYISGEEFERRLERSLREIVRVVKSDGIVTIVFAHTDVVAWERLLRSLQSVGLVVSTSWPMRSERAGRQLAQVKAALGSSVVLVCRPQDAHEEGFFDDVIRALEDRISERLDAFEEMGLVGADYFVSAIGPAFEVFAQYSRIVKLSGEEVDVGELMVLARQAVARHAMRRLLGAEPLNELDAQSLFYLTWRWAYLVAAIPADEAYKLERAFDVDLSVLSGPSGFARRSGSNFSLLGPQDRRIVRLNTAPALIDVLHLACQLWDAGRRRELEELLGATGMGEQHGFWAMARALAQILPDGNRERTMLLGLTSNQEPLSAAAARSSIALEELTLFDQKQF